MRRRSLLSESIGRLNTRGGDDDSGGFGGLGGGALGAPPADPLTRMVHVLDVHLNAFQFLEANANKLDAALRQADQLLAQPRHPASMLY